MSKQLLGSFGKTIRMFPAISKSTNILNQLLGAEVGHNIICIRVSSGVISVVPGAWVSVLISIAVIQHEL